MKTLIVSLFLFQLAGLAQDEAPAPQEDRQGVVVENEGDVLQKMTQTMPELQEILDGCENGAVFNPTNRPKDTCVWEEVQERRDLHAQVIEALNTYREPERETASSAEPANESEGEAPKYNYNLDNFKRTKTKSITKLEEFLQSRFEKALYGDSTEGVKAVRDHTNFYRLWQSQLGKSLITELSRYCIFSDPANGKVPHRLSGSQDKKAATFNRQKNLENLGQRTPNDESGAFRGFEACIAQIPGECSAAFRVGATPPPPEPNDPQGLSRESTGTATASYQEHLRNNGADVEEYTGVIMSPCELNRYMTGVKKSLTQVEGLVEELDQQAPSEAHAINLRQQEALNINRITNVGSGEIQSAQEYQDAVAEEAQELEECVASNGQNPECEAYLSSAEENKKIEDEAILRGVALKLKIENELINGTDNEEDLMEFFTEKGMSAENFNLMITQRMQHPDNEGKDRIQVIKDLIKNSYEDERKAIQASLRARLNETQVTPADEASGTDEERPDFNVIKSRIESSPQELAIVYHYANVVSSFLQVGEGDNATKNTAALAAELENNAFDDGTLGGRDTASDGPSFNSNIDDLAEFSEGPDSANGNNPEVQLGSGEIDQIQFGIREEEP